MTKKAVATRRLAPARVRHAVGGLMPPIAPRWIAWVPLAAMVWALGYGAVRVWWAVAGAPSFGPPMGTDLLAFTGWGAVGLCAAAAGVALALMTAPWRWPLLALAWGVSAALVVAPGLLLLDVVGLLTGLRVTFHGVAFVSRAACLIAGVLLASAAEAYRRRWRSACLFCGRTRVRPRPTHPPRWAWFAAYLAVAGCLARLGAQAAVGFDMLQGGGSVLVFEAGFLLAGVVLPLALVHSWGRVVPRWLPGFGGRRVPRWLLLAPAFALATGMTAYFGFSIVGFAVQTLSGTWDRGDGSLPLAFFWVALPGYLVWGLGLGVAAVAYYQVTQPLCRVCGR